jgi:hypothetical protein
MCIAATDVVHATMIKKGEQMLLSRIESFFFRLQILQVGIN